MYIDESWPEPMRVYNERFTKLFGMPAQSAGQMGNTLTLRFSNGNHSFKDSKYFLNPSRQIFSHLTTYKGLFGIVNSGSMRLYNLDNSNDPNELFSLKGIPPYEAAATNVKRYVHTFSFCRDDAVAKPEMWVKYGQVVLNFEIANDPLAWEYYRISPMHYGECDFVAEYTRLSEEMRQMFPDWEFDPDLESLLSLLAFHKEKIHQDETEVRLLHVPFLFDRRDAQFDFRVSKVHTGLTKFVELPLFVENSERRQISQAKRHNIVRDDSLPLIKIISIQFGDNEPNFDQAQLTKIRYELEDYLIAKFGYHIEIKQDLFETGVV
ncbi:MAG TPA: hypothetical protein VK508_00710 [Cyclobacteriaceae bacterium]|nr:hypothetical protein [Cyclobacteriaceae bacterium]